MLLGFKDRFAPMILDGTKTHTIRATRKVKPKVGEICHCYTGLRTKRCRLLGRWQCVRVDKIRILLFSGLQIRIGEMWLDPGEKMAFAWSDGFRTGSNWLGEMQNFWMRENGLRPAIRRRRGWRGAWDGYLIEWKFDRTAAK